MTAVVAAPQAGPRPDRARNAASARRRELAATRDRLGGGHHAELRAALGLARLSCSAGLAADLADLTRRAGERLDTCGRAGRAELPSWLAGELDEVRRRSAERFEATAGPAVRRVAARLRPGAPPMPLPGTTGLARSATAPVAPGAVSTVATGPRLLAGLAGLPVLGAGGLGGATALTTAGVVLVLAALAHTRSVAAARARLAAATARALAAAGADAERELAFRLIEVERAVGAVLDRAVADRRARVERETAELRDASG